MKKAFVVAILAVVLLMGSAVSYGADMDMLSQCNFEDLVQSRICSLQNVFGNGETLYFSDPLAPDDGISILYRASLDPDTQKANLVPLPLASRLIDALPGEIPFNNALAIAANASEASPR